MTQAAKGIAIALSQSSSIANKVIVVNVLDCPDALLGSIGYNVQVVVREDVKRGRFMIMSEGNYGAFALGRNNEGLI